MPVRMLEYLSRYYEDYTKRDGKALVFSKTLVRLPKPEFIVFYNGEAGQENEIEYRLTDAFEQVTTLTSIELTVNVYNINYDAHTELLAKSRELHDYASFIHKVKHYLSESNVIGTAIALAVRDSIEEGVMVKYLKERREETYSMLMTQYVIDEQIKAARHDERVEAEERMQSALEARIQAAREDERREAEERLKASVRSMKADGVDITFIAKHTGLSVTEIQDL
jgi:hypothetical protein